MHPFGLGFTTVLPAGVTDWAAEVKTEPDAYLGSPAEPDDDRLARPRAYAQPSRGLVEVDPVPDRVLVVPADPWAAARDALLGPLIGGGSAVVTDLSRRPPRRAGRVRKGPPRGLTPEPARGSVRVTVS